MQKESQTRRSLHIDKRRASFLRHVAEAFPPASQWTILNFHRVIGIATNNSMALLNCSLVTYVMMTADVGLADARLFLGI